MGGLIIFCVFIWLLIGCIGVGIATNPDMNAPYKAVLAVFFWPVTLPIFLVAGFITAVLYSFVTGMKMVGGKF